MNSFIEEVDWLNGVDLTQGFSSWHIKWPIGILGSGPPKVIFSEIYDTSMSNKNGKLKLYWRLKLVNLDVSLSNYKLGVNSSILSVPTPVICRYALSYEGENPIFTSSYCAVLSSDEYWYEILDGSVFKRDVNLTVHCWMDIPNDVLKFIETRRVSDLKEDEELTVDCVHNPSNIKVFLGDSEAMYKGAIGEEKSFASLSDVTLVMLQKSELSDGRFYCHRNVLAARSPVFFSMFTTSQWKEGEDRIVEIDDIHEKIMKVVLYHIYTGQFADVGARDLPALIYAADKYQLRCLKSWSWAQLITGDFNDEDRIDHLLLAERHQLPQLKAACIAMLSINAKALKNLERSALSTELFGELMEAVSKRQVKTDIIETTTDPDYDG